MYTQDQAWLVIVMALTLQNLSKYALSVSLYPEVESHCFESVLLDAQTLVFDDPQASVGPVVRIILFGWFVWFVSLCVGEELIYGLLFLGEGKGRWERAQFATLTWLWQR